MAFHFGDGCVQVDGDKRIRVDLFDGLVEKRLDVGAIKGAIDPARRAAERLGLLDYVHRESLVREGQGGRHAGHPAANDQGGVVDGHEFVLEWHQFGGTRDDHAHEVVCLRRGGLAVAGMNPRTLFADVRHFEKIGIEAGVAQGVAKDRFMRARGA